jgi:imidazole glycerol-phosphate synthase subunit HisH
MLAGSENGPPVAEHQGGSVTIAIVDYGAGNLVSVRKAIAWLGHPCAITSDRTEVSRASKIILPGVGHFASTAVLGTTGLREEMKVAIGKGVPFLGICVGMQWLFEGSEEAPDTSGLGLLAGRCTHFPTAVKSPHVGWNGLTLHRSSRLFRGLETLPFVYFTHSFRAPVCDTTVAGCEYGGVFSAAVEQESVFGVQFHPEKSGEAGLRLLENFCEL